MPPSRHDVARREPHNSPPVDAAAFAATLNTPPRSVSIIVNNFNYARYLGEAIESALTQTRPAQVIVVDDASTDGSRDIVATFGDRVVPVLKAVNGGQASAMNEGIGVASGDLVIFLDSDDRLAPTAVETLLARWRPGTAMAQYPLTIIDTVGTPIGIYPDPPSGLPDGDVRAELLATGGYVTTVTTGLAFARPALLSVMPIPTQPFRYAADGYLTRAVAFRGPVQRIDECLGLYRKHGRNDADVCSAPGGIAEGFRKKITHARNEFDTTRDCANSNGYSVPSNIGDLNPDYLGYRLFSLLLEPGEHPINGDRRLSLLFHYLGARWRSTWRTPRKALWMALASAATVSPRAQAETFIRWLHDPSSRPSWFPSRNQGRV